MGQVEAFPWWVVKPEGRLLLTEADFQATIGFKWGTFIEGTGTVTTDSNHYYGGTRSVKLATGTVNGQSAEIKINLPYFLGKGRYAFEQKWAYGDPAIAFAASSFQMGIEPRENKSDGFWQGRMKWFFTQKEWRYESASDVYTAFTDPLITEEPNLNTVVGGTGDLWGWTRLVIDTIKKEYVSFEATELGKIAYRDMSGIPLVNRGSATKYNLLVFALMNTGGNGADVARTTDWAISLVD